MICKEVQQYLYSPGISAIGNHGYYSLRRALHRQYLNQYAQEQTTTTVYLKDCLKGFYIPPAFTPNNAVLNDVFKPVIGAY